MLHPSRHLVRALMILAVITTGTVEAQYIKDLARVEGIRLQHMKGPGLVVGLPGTGDSSRSGLTRQLYANILKNVNIDINEDDFRSRNVAVVMVTASISSATKVGSSIDVTVSSIGDAKSLKGGWLLETALMGPGTGSSGAIIYAVAQGGLNVQAGQGLTVGRAGAILEEDISIPFQAPNGTINLILDRPDFSTANRIARAINELPYFALTAEKELPLAHAWDAGSVRVKIPERFRAPDRVVDFISRVTGEVKVADVDRSATVVIDSKSGLVTVNGRVRVAPVFIIIGDMQIRIPPQVDPARPDPPGFDPGARQPLLLEVLDELRKQGVRADQMPQIIKSIDRAGALVGKLMEL